MADKELAAKVVKHHVLKNHLCCAGITKSILFFDTSNKRTLGGDIISVRRSNGGYLYADRCQIPFTLYTTYIVYHVYNTVYIYQLFPRLLRPGTNVIKLYLSVIYGFP